MYHRKRSAGSNMPEDEGAKRLSGTHTTPFSPPSPTSRPLSQYVLRVIHDLFNVWGDDGVGQHFSSGSTVVGMQMI